MKLLSYMEEIIARPSVTRKILKKYDIHLTKSMGQNMLVDRNILDIIVDVAQIGTKDLVLEIGPGIGSLTQLLLSEIKEGHLIAVEKDKKLAEVLHDFFSDCSRLEIINADILEWDWISCLKQKEHLYDKIKIAANLPYYITSPIMMNFLESTFYFSRMVFLMQKEVAERIVSAPGSKKYGSLSVAVQYYGRPEIVHEVPPTVFIPRPEVTSSVLVIHPYKEKPVKVQNEDFFFKVVKSIFQQRRKTLKNSIYKGSVLNINKNKITRTLERCGLDPKIRGEKLSVAEIAAFSDKLLQNVKKEVT